jgi:hypothetical protein
VPPNAAEDLDDDPEVKKETMSFSTLASTSSSNLDDIFQRFSSCMKCQKCFKAKGTKMKETMETDRKFKSLITLK